MYSKAQFRESFLSEVHKDGFLVILAYNFGDHMMSIERNLIITVLKLTKNGAASHGLVKRESRIPDYFAEKLLHILQNQGLVYVGRDYIEVDSYNRLKLAVRAIGLGADSEVVSSFLQWKEFEAIVALILEANGYLVTRNLRFKHAGRRWEIDIIACKKPIAICIDCKHWHHGISPSTLKTIVKEQIERAKAFADSLPSPNIRTECVTWNELQIVPAILSLVASNLKFLENVPIVPILQLQDFLTQLPAYGYSLKHFSVTSGHFKNRLSRKP